jgi:hypothetical protein
VKRSGTSKLSVVGLAQAGVSWAAASRYAFPIFA